jgi:DNA-directed RNA polymerase subunit RPC12/RpoP
MTQSFSCFACQKVFPILSEENGKCPSCGSADGEILSPERVREGMQAGVYFNIDPKTGKHKKPPRKS